MSQDVWFLTKPTVTTKEAAKMLGITVQTVLKKEKEGLLQCVYPESYLQKRLKNAGNKCMSLRKRSLKCFDKSMR